MIFQVEAVRLISEGKAPKLVQSEEGASYEVSKFIKLIFNCNLLKPYITAKPGKIILNFGINRRENLKILIKTVNQF